MRRWLGVGAVIVLLLAAATARAQSTTGTIAGRIADAQGFVMPGVIVTATGSQGAKSAVTDGEGRFSLPLLTPGRYTVRAELQGFKTIDRSDIDVRLDQRVDLAMTMEIGDLTESVTVVGAPAQLNPTSATITTNLDSSTLASLPVGRRFSDTLYLAPGVSSLGVRPFSVPAQPFPLRQPTADSPSDFRLTGGRRAWSTPIRSTHSDAGRRTATVAPRPDIQSLSNCARGVCARTFTFCVCSLT